MLASSLIVLVLAQASNEPVSIDVTSSLAGERGFSRAMSAASVGNTDQTARDVQAALTGIRWLEHTTSDPEVLVRVEKRERTEVSRRTDNKGKLSIVHRYTAHATLEMEGRVEQISADHDYTETSGTRDDAEQFRQVAKEMAGDIVRRIEARLDDLRPDRARPGFTHEAKYRFLVKGDGLQVVSVDPGSPAEGAGLRVGDRIRRINAEKGTDQMDALVRGWWVEPPGSRYVFEIERDKKRQVIEVSPAVAPARAANKPASTGTGRARASATGTAAASVELKPGMTEAEVVRALGEPEKKVAFGAKTIWSYPGFTVTLVKGKVTDVQ